MLSREMISLSSGIVIIPTLRRCCAVDERQHIVRLLGLNHAAVFVCQNWRAGLHVDSPVCRVCQLRRWRGIVQNASLIEPPRVGFACSDYFDGVIVCSFINLGPR